MTQQTFRFDHVTSALDIKAPTLRRWLQLGVLGQTMGEQREGWVLEFTPHDIAILALVQAMTEFGVPVAFAHRLAGRAMRDHAGLWSGDQPLEAHWTAWPIDSPVIISRAEDRNGKPGWSIAVFENAEEAYTLGAHLTIYPHKLIRAVIERALKAAVVRAAKRTA